MICPNCKKEFSTTFFPDKCPYCKFMIRKKENPYDPELYNFLKEDYLVTKNKAESIKHGMKQFGRSVGELREILNFIADEVYEENNHRSYEEINDNGKYRFKMFEFSFWEYLKHNLIYKLMILGLWSWLMKFLPNMAFNYDIEDLFGIWGLLVGDFVLIWIFLVQFMEVERKSVMAEGGTIIYSDERGGEVYLEDRTKYYERTVYEYRIELVKEIRETRNYVWIKGQITYVVLPIGRSGKYSKRVDKVKIPKYFKHNKEMLQVFRDYKR